MKKLSVTGQIIILMVTIGIMGAGVGLFGIYKISESNARLNTVLEDTSLPFQDLKNLSFMFGSTILLDIEKMANEEMSWEIGQKSYKSLRQFVSDITETSNLISQITKANLEQNEGISGVNSSIQMLNQITQQNAASSKEMATVSEEMAAQILKESIQYFKFQEQDSLTTNDQKYLNLSNRKNT